LNGGDRRRVALLEHPRLRHYEGGRQRRRRQHEQIAEHTRSAAACSGDKRDPAKRKQEPAPGQWPDAPPTHGSRHYRDQQRHGADHDRGMAHARVLHPGVLEQDHATEAERSGQCNTQRDSVAQVPAGDQREDWSGHEEPRNGQPGGSEPCHREL
jgi:hypothetical protein